MSGSSVIKIEHCNNIKSAELEFFHDKLNIFYGKNGTGKSTIAKALFLQSQNESLESLRPYTKDTFTPKVEGIEAGDIAIFDEKYVNQYVYQKDTVIENAFKVFVESAEYRNAKNNIDTIFLEIKNSITEDEEIKSLQTQLEQLIKVIKKTASTNKLSKTGGIKGVLSGKGGYTNPPATLSKLEPFFKDSIVIDYAKWRNDGNKNFGDEACCPYCSIDNIPELPTINKAFAETFDKASVEFAKNVIAALCILEDYLYDNAVLHLKSLFGSEKSKDDLEVQLNNIINESTYLDKRLKNIVSFNGSSITRDNISSLEEALENMRINTDNLSKYFVAEKTITKINSINALVDSVLSKVNILKQEIGKYNKYISDAIKKSERDINTFLQIAGINYKFSVVLQEGFENTASAILEFIMPDDELEKVALPANHLSWGEKNAFALVMFMFDTLSRDNVKLIILDDPISSFDTDKKYAITDRLFKVGTKGKSFYERTVLLFTHDLEPVINYVQTTPGGQTPNTISASYMKNAKGIIHTDSIVKGVGLVPNVVLLKEIATTLPLSLPIRVASLRKYVEHTHKKPAEESAAYHILSNLIHARVNMNYKSEDCNLNNDEFEIGCCYIKRFIADFDYTEALAQYSSDGLIAAYNDEQNTYFKMLLLRAICEVRSNLKETLKNANPALKKYIDETNHIENDSAYVLDYRVFDIVPANLLDEAEKFITSIEF
ncbi:MAG: AAA family ATPase [Defluviitaleaceae bacterium]|nr:AAA family ATPase [Defluviitaleaceae bacterium]